MKNSVLLYTFCCLLMAFVGDAQVVINEYSAANLHQHYDNYGKSEDWIELYNGGASAVQIGGWHLTDTDNNLSKWTFPAGTAIPAQGYLLIWCSGRNTDLGGILHTNFKITQTKSTPEHLILTDASNIIVDDRNVKKTKFDQSIGRKIDGGSDWGISTMPTPGNANITANFYEDFAKKVVMDREPGFYAASFLLALSTTEPNAEIRYTLNGNEPTLTSTLYTGPISIEQTRVVKAIAVSPDPTILPSFTEFNTYFINEQFTMPVVSVAGTNLLNLVNGNQGLRPKGSFEFFGTDLLRHASVTGEFNSHGQDSWVNDQRSIDWVSRDEMGEDNAIEEALFPNLTNRNEFQRVILRAAGDDNYPGGSGYTDPQGHPLSAHMRDAYTQNLAVRGKMHVDSRTASKAIIFMNGQYWGIYDLRELPDDHDYTEYYYNQGKYDLQYLLTWGDTWVQYWDSNSDSAQVYDQWHDLWQFIQTNDMAIPANYDQVKSELDVPSLVDYVIVNSFANASDWLNYNTGWWRGTNPDGTHDKWGYILWDLDATYAYYINYTGIPDTSATSPPCNVEQIVSPWSDPEGHIAMLNKLRENPEFDQYWLTRQADMMKTVFSCDNMLSYFDSIVTVLTPEMPRHISKWGGTMAEWEGNVARFRDFIVRRCNYLPFGMIDCYNLTGPHDIVILSDPPGAGSVKANSLVYNNLPVSTPIYGNINLNLEALPNPGYIFQKWGAYQHNIVDPSAAITSVVLTASDTIVAKFESTSVPVIEIQKAGWVSVTPTIIDNGFQLNYTLDNAAKVVIKMTDLQGKELFEITPEAGYCTAGSHNLQFKQADSLPAGLYFLQVTAGKSSEMVKLIVSGMK